MRALFFLALFAVWFWGLSGLFFPAGRLNPFAPRLGYCRTEPCIRGTIDIPCPRPRPEIPCVFPLGGTP